MTKCACGCGDPVPTNTKGEPVGKYAHPDRCRHRAYRKRLKDEAEAHGLPASLSLKKLETVARTNPRGGDGVGAGGTGKPRVRRQRSGVSVYFPSLDAVKAARAELNGSAGEITEPLDRAIARKRSGSD